MSGIYIPGVTVPEDNTILLRIFPESDGICYTEQLDIDEDILDKYFAVPVPDHGRLIDADALEKDIDKYIGGEESRSRFHHWVQVQSVVIPGNKGEQT